MCATNCVPFLDLVTPHLELEQEIVSVVQDALRTGSYIGGPVVESFESQFAEFCDTEFCVGVGSGTDAVRFALIAAGVRPGESVITVPNTFIATTEAISQVGAVPEFVDIDEGTYNLDPKKLREFVKTQCDVEPDTGRLFSQRTGRMITAVVPVHLYGQMADMDPILELANAHNLVVVEDACQAHGAEYFSRREQCWKKAGSVGRAAAFSFYPGKNLGACGEAGAVTTNDAAVAIKIRMLRDHGQMKKYHHDIEGYNGRLDAIQAGLLKVKLAHLADWNAKRRNCAAEYNRILASAVGAIVLPHEPSWSRAVYHLYVVRTDNRDAMIGHLRSAGIGTGIHYPIPLHLQNAYTSLGYKSGDFPVSEKVAEDIFSLPMFPQLTSDQQARVADAIQNALVARWGIHLSPSCKSA